MAQKKSGGRTKNGRDSCGKRLGLKCFGGQAVTSGAILVRQRGTKVLPGINTSIGRDHTVYANTAGYTFFKKIRSWKVYKTYIHVKKSL